MFVLNRIADLVILGAHPDILLITMSVQFGQSAEALVGSAVIDEPSV